MDHVADNPMTEHIKEILAEPSGSSEFMARLESAHQRLDPENPDQMLSLAMLYWANPKLPDSAGQCASLLKSAARLGHPLAVERLADQFALGWAVPEDVEKSLNLYHQLSAYLIPHVLRELCWMMWTTSSPAQNPGEGLRHLVKAVLLGDSVALRWLNSISQHWREVHGPDQQLPAAVGRVLEACDGRDAAPEDDQTITRQLPQLRDPNVQHRDDMLDGILATLDWPEQEIIRVVESIRRERRHPEMLSWRPRLCVMRQSVDEFQLDLLDGLHARQDDLNSGDPQAVQVSVHDQGPVMRSILDVVALSSQIPPDHQERAELVTIDRSGLPIQGEMLSQSQIREAALCLDDSGQRIVLCILALDPMHITGIDDNEGIQLSRGDLLIHHLTRPDGLPDTAVRSRLMALTDSNQAARVLRIGVRQHSRVIPVMDTL